MALYVQALAEIRTIEQRLKRELAKEQAPLAKALIGDRGSAFLKVYLHTLRDSMAQNILRAGRTAYAAGVGVADRRIRRDRAAQVRQESFRGAADVEAPPLPEVWAQWYEATLDTSLYRYTEQVRRDIGRLTIKAALEGWTNDRLTAEVRKLSQSLTTWRAEMIARTEMMRLWNLGHYGRMEQEEDIVGYTYSVVLDIRTSHVCRPIAGLHVRREALRWVPPLHPHCRTILEPLYEFDDVPSGSFGDPLRPQVVKGFGAVPKLPAFSSSAAAAGGAPGPAKPPKPPTPPPPPPRGSGGSGDDDAGDKKPLVNQAWVAQVKTVRKEELQGKARLRRTTPEGYELLANGSLQKAVDGMQPFVRLDSSSLQSVLRDGRFKTQFETGASKGIMNPGARSFIEENLFGFDPSGPAHTRPVYGYLDRKATKARASEQHYGSVIIRLKAAIRERTTFTVGDSLVETRMGAAPVVAPAPLDAASWTAAPERLVDPVDYPTAAKLLERVRQSHAVRGVPPLGYVEAQYHGGVTVSDIEEIVFTAGGPAEDMQQTLKRLQIPWRVV